MFDKKIDVDRHVENCLRKTNSETERNLRSFAFAKLYFNVGEAELARRYVSSYLVVKPHSAEAHQLMGKILEKLGRRDAALDEYRISLDLDPKQNGLVLKVCELLASDDILLEPIKARYWCEQAQMFDPQNQAVFNLKERLVSNESNNPDDIRKLFLSELEGRPTDVGLRVRLLKHLLQNNQITDAYKHVAEIEQKNLSIFSNHIAWYETVTKVLVRYKNDNISNSVLSWDFWMLIISILDKVVALSLDENSASIKSLSECVTNVFNLDQMLTVASEKVTSNCLEKQFSQEFLIHYRAQLCFHIATLIFKQAKKDQIKYKEAINLVLPLLLVSYHSQPVELQCVWLDHTTEEIRKQIQRWHREASYRCSQAGHTLLAIVKERRSNFVDRVTQLCSGSWREKTFKNIFITRDQQLKTKSSYFVNNPQLEEITVKLPESSDLLRYDETAQLVHPDSLHHMIWIGFNNQPAKFRCTMFDGLQYSVKNLNHCAAETLNVLDIQAFIYCCIFCAQSQIEDSRQLIYYNQDKPNVLPASITEPLGTLNQTKWFASVYKMFRNECGSDVSDVRVTLIKGIEIVRCAGAHGLDVKLLVMLANTFAQRAKLITKQSDMEHAETRAELYWKSALPLLEKLRNNQAITYPLKRWFEYRGKDMTHTEISMHLEEGKLFSAIQLMKKKSHEKALQLLESLKNPYASFYQAQTYKLLADEQMSHNKENVTSEMRSQHIILLSRARDCLYLTLDRLREPSVDRKHPLNTQLGTEIEMIERLLSRIDPDICGNRNDCDGMSDENVSSVGSEHANISSAYMTHSSFQNGNMTPRNDHVATGTYGNLELTLNHSRRAEARPSPERLDAQLRQMAASKDAAVAHILEQNKMMVESHRNLVDELRGFKEAITHLTSSVDELRGIRKSVDELKVAVDDLQNLKEAVEQVYEIKKDLAELKKDTTKLKNSQINEEDLYALEDEYGVDYNIATNAAAFNSAAMYPNFPQRLQGANTLAYGAPGLYGMYPMYPYGGLGLGQPGALPFPEGHIPDFRSMGSIAQGLSHTGLTQSQAPLAQSVPPNMFPNTAVVPPSSTIPSHLFPQRPVVSQPGGIPSTFVLPNQVTSTTMSSYPSGSLTSTVINPVINNPLPVNVVITASDPLPTTSAAQPILSVTIPPQHLKGNHQNKKQPHNYQIPLPINTLPTFSNVSSSITPMPISTQNLLSNIAPPVFSSLSVHGPVQLTSKGLGLQIEKSLNQNFSNSSYTSQGADVTQKSQHNESNASEASVEEHDPCPDFKPIIPLPDEINITTGEEDESVLFCERAKLYRFVDKEWRERGIGNIKLLHNGEDGKVRVLMRREQVHKICANHFITPDMVLTPMQNSDRAYIWAANDFADENIVLEKLCIRFKGAEEGNRFVESFERAKTLVAEGGKGEKSRKPKEAPMLFSSTPKLEERVNASLITPTPKIISESQPVTSLGGFVFTTPPTFKPKTDATPDIVGKPQNILTSKQSPFASFTFGTKTSEPAVDPKPKVEFKPVQKQPAEPTLKESLTPKAKGMSAIVIESPHETEDFIPTTEFKPVIPLPDLVEVKTGEENSEVVHEVKAKLLRYDSEAREWKERGVGIMKILKEKTIRLVMRREHVHKVCCNHQLLKSMLFTNMPKNNRVLNWCAQDYSENILVTEMFAIRFRTPELCETFLFAVQNAQAMLDSSNNVMSSSRSSHDATSVKPHVASGWGDKFKAKQNTWQCSVCYIRNESQNENCVACGATDDSNQAQSPQKFKPSVSPQPPPPNWGDKFKQKVGTWECKTCYVHNDGKKNYCEACDTPKNDTIPKKDTTVDQNASGNQFSFGFTSPNFGTPALNVSSAGFSFGQQTEAVNVTSDWGDKFKPKAGAWACNSCYILNDPDKLYCVACDSPKDDTVPKEQESFSFGTVPASITSTTNATKASFSFGQTPAVTNASSSWGDKFKPKAGAWECKSCYISNISEALYCVACNNPKDETVPKKDQGIDLTSSTDQKFTFGMPSIATSIAAEPIFGAKTTSAVGFSFGLTQSKTPSTSFTFGMPKEPITEPTTPKQTTPLDLAPKTLFTFNLKTPLTPTLNVDESGTPKNDEFVFGSPNKHEFEFKPRSPRKQSGGDGDDSDGSVGEDEGEHIYFKPVIPLPDKVEVLTGEENEEVLYCHRAKLFRFTAGEWKERGIGDIKILKHTATGKLRVLMRREQVLKICLNHALTEDITYKPKDVRTWLFCSPDYSEGEIRHEQFCIRFKNAETAKEFIDSVDSARGSTTPSESGEPKKIPDEQTEDDIILVYELKVTAEEEQRALALQLPKNFYAYLQKPPCKGCIGCNPDDFVFETVKTTTKSKQNSGNKMSTSASTKTELTKPKKSIVETALKTDTNIFTTPASNSIFGGTNNSSFSFSVPKTESKPSSNFSFLSLSNTPFPSFNTIAATTVSSASNAIPKSTISQSPLLFAPNSVGSTITPIFSQSPRAVEHKSPIAPPKLTTSAVGSLFVSPSHSQISTSIFSGTPTSKPSVQSNIFGGTPKLSDASKGHTSIFGGLATDAKKPLPSPVDGNNAQSTADKGQLFDFTKTEASNQNVMGSLFGGPSIFSSAKSESLSLFGSSAGQKSYENTSVSSAPPTMFSSLFGLSAKSDEKASSEKLNLFGGVSRTAYGQSDIAEPKFTVPILSTNSPLSFASLASESQTFITEDESKPFMFDGVGTLVFGGNRTEKTVSSANTSEVKQDNDDTAEGHTEGADEDYDPHYEPVVPLPDAIVVKTGEEEENVLFNERAKLYRFNTDTKEWKERGVGQIKLLHHPVNETYRMLMRREQVHKLVLNQLLTADLDLQPLSSSDCAWLWGGYNYSEDGGALEKLSLRFKTTELAQQFYKAVQSAMENVSKYAAEHAEDYPEEEYNSDDSDETRSIMFSKRCTLSVKEGSDWNVLTMGIIKIYFDSDLYGCRIVMHDDNGTPVSNTIIAVNTIMKLDETTCSWRAMEWSLAEPRPRVLRARFSSIAAANEMYYNFEEAMQYAHQCDIVDDLPEESF